MPLRALILDHFWLKLFSLVLATLIWLSVRANVASSGTEVARTFVNRPILILSDTAEHTALVVNPSNATVSVRGPAALIQELTVQDIHVFIRMNDPRQPGGELPIHAHVPFGATVALITPATAIVRPAGTP